MTMLSEIPTPVTMQRIKQLLEAEEWTYRVDSDGDPAVPFEHCVLGYTLQGRDHEVLVGAGAWDGLMSATDQEHMRDVCQDWNRDRFWPKTFCIVNDEGVLRVHAEFAVDYEQGATDAQLRQHIVCFTATANHFFNELAERFPEALPTA